MSKEKRHIQVEILDTKTDEHRFVFASAGEIISPAKHERVVGYRQVGVIKGGDPILVLHKSKSKVVALDRTFWHVRKNRQ